MFFKFLEKKLQKIRLCEPKKFAEKLVHVNRKVSFWRKIVFYQISNKMFAEKSVHVNQKVGFYPFNFTRLKIEKPIISSKFINIEILYVKTQFLTITYLAQISKTNESAWFVAKWSKQVGFHNREELR